jgi:hypothetical protein
MKTNAKKRTQKDDTQPATIDAYRLGKMVGLTERRLRQLAAGGVIPNPLRNRYPFATTLHAILAYYRKRDENRDLEDVYPSFSACSKATGIPIEQLKRAKRLKCPAIRGYRVDLAGFLAWHHGKGGNEPINLEAEQARYVKLQNAKLKLMVGRLKGEYIPADEVRRLGAELGRALRRVILTTHRLAPSIAGSSKERIEKLLKDHEESILSQLHIMDRTFESWKAMGVRVEKTLGGLEGPISIPR